MPYLELRPSERSTPERPLWVWRLWCCSRPVCFGLAASPEEARRQAEKAFAEHQRRAGGLRLEQLLHHEELWGWEL